VEISDNTLNSDGEIGEVSLSVTIVNTGDRAGKEVAQVYISAPEVKLEKPAIELKAFDKTQLLQANQSETLTLTVSAKALASFNPESDQWIVEPGQYQVYVAPSSDVKGAEFGPEVMPVSFTVDKEIVVADTVPGSLALEAGVNSKDIITVKK